MPRNGDGSSDNGPIEGQEVVHGTSGDVRSRTSSLSSPLFQFQIDLLLTNLVTDHPSARQEQRRADAGDREGRRYDHPTRERNDEVWRTDSTTALEGMNASGGGVLPKGENAGQGKGEDSNKK
jgi:hypothetical protein